MKQARQTGTGPFKHPCLLTHQAVYTVLKEAEHRSVMPLPYWTLPFAKELVPRQRRCIEALVLINRTLDGLIE